MNVKVLVVFDSRRGSVERLAHAVSEGAASVSGTDVLVKRVQDVVLDDLLSCDGLAVGSPVHTGTVSIPVKQFFDRWQFEFDFYPEWPMSDRVGAAFAAGGRGAGGREFTLLTIVSALLHHRLILVAEGGTVGSSASTETKDEPVDETELADARALGRRLAEVSAIVRRGRVDEGRRRTT